jgi:exodeoxyribonuclease V alpha subunit
MEENAIVSVEMDETQATAVHMCNDLTKRLVAVSGPAGSGKTTIIKNVHEHFFKKFTSVVLAAPTGKAARRIKEATGIDAITIHKLLEYNRPGERDEKTGKPLDVTKPKRDRSNPLDYKVVIVDEYAMVNHELHNNLLAALPSGGCIRAFGDINQLPPIEEYKITDKRGGIEKTPFQKLIERPDSIVLTKVYRQGEGSAILQAADKIRKGHTPPINEDLGEFHIRVSDRPLDVLKMYIRQQLSEGVNFGKIENQVITPTRKSWVGTQKLNQVLRTILNPNPAQTIPLERHKWDKDGVTIGVGDKVVCTSNTYDMRNYFERFEEWTNDMVPIMSSYIPCPPTKQMLNGETGIVTQIYPDGGIDIDFGDRIVEVPVIYQEYWSQKDTVIDVSPMRDIDLAFALTTHKCQGSEFQQICYVLNKSAIFTQSRQNFYTAVTRARKKAFIIGDQKSIQTSIFKVVK